MIDSKYLRTIEDYSQDELKTYNHINSVKYYKQIADACFDIQNYSIDYIIISFLTPSYSNQRITLNNAPHWAIPYIAENWAIDDPFLNTETFYKLGTDHIFQQEYTSQKHKKHIFHEFSNIFNIQELCTIVKFIHKLDINISIHTKHFINDYRAYYKQHKDKILKFISLFIIRLKSVILEICPILQYNKILWNEELLLSALRSKFHYEKLTQNQIEILNLTSKGFSIDEIAKKIGCNKQTVNSSMSIICKKFNCQNAFQAVSKAYYLNLLQRNHNQIDKKLFNDIELKIIFWTLKGYTTKEIAIFCNLNFEIVQKILIQAQEKLNVKNKIQLIYKMYNNKLLDKFFL